MVFYKHLENVRLVEQIWGAPMNGCLLNYLEDFSKELMATISKCASTLYNFKVVDVLNFFCQMP